MGLFKYAPKLFLLFFLLATPFLPIEPAHAVAEWQAGRIIDDEVFTRSSAMNAAQVQKFLESKNSVCLVNYETAEPLGNNQYGAKVPASYAIWKAAQLFDLNPQVLIVTLQKEQGLVTTDTCSSYKYRSAMGFGCPDSEPCDAQWYGLSRQLYQGARHLRGFFDQKEGWYIPYTPGSRFIQWHPNSDCGGKTVNIINRATAALYSYTPYQPNAAALAAGYGTGNSCSSYGNRNFWLYFNDWFGTTYGVIGDYFRFIECDGTKYVIERYVARKVPITPDGMAAWGFGTFFYVPDDPGCSYETSSAEVDALVTSRNSGYTYLVDSQNAFRFHSSSIKRAWGIDSLPAGSIPDFAGPAISNILDVEDTLSRVVQSTNSNKFYLIDGGERHFIVGSALNPSAPSLRLLTGYDIDYIAVSPDYIRELPAAADLDYYFKVGTVRYVLDHGTVRKVDPNNTTPGWNNLMGWNSAPTLSQDLVNILGESRALVHGFRRSSLYYAVRPDGSIQSTSSSTQASSWHVDDEPIVTTLLHAKLLNY